VLLQCRNLSTHQSEHGSFAISSAKFRTISRVGRSPSSVNPCMYRTSSFSCCGWSFWRFCAAPALVVCKLWCWQHSVSLLTPNSVVVLQKLCLHLASRLSQPHPKSGPYWWSYSVLRWGCCDVVMMWGSSGSAVARHLLQHCTGTVPVHPMPPFGQCTTFC
jgi:hypothetical protein